MSNPADDTSIYSPSPTSVVVGPGEFLFAAAYLDHGHIDGQTEGLLAAGGSLAYVYDPDPAKVAAFQKRFGQVRAARSFDEVLEERSVRLVAAAAIPSERCAIGLRVMDAGKDYFTDKSPFTTPAHLESARRAVATTGQKYAVYYAERLHNRPTYYAGELVRGGAIGKVLQMIILAPHNLTPQRRPEWFFQKQRYGGIITDIGSHQFEQFLYFSGQGVPP